MLKCPNSDETKFYIYVVNYASHFLLIQRELAVSTSVVRGREVVYLDKY